jgi:hypothetical protein
MSVAVAGGGQAALEDITGGIVGDWLVVGWFTPDYRPLAERLAANLTAHGAPFHLWAKPKLAAGWNTKRKPQIVLEAMEAYPDKTLILMDVDCLVKGDLSPVASIATDIGIALKPREGRKSRVVFTASSRVVVFRPTASARSFAETWAELCEASGRSNDEPSLAWAYVRRPDLTYTQLDQRYIGREVNTANAVDGIVIWHDSAHDPVRGRSSWGAAVRHLLKRLEMRYFRSGATRAALQQTAGPQ